MLIEGGYLHSLKTLLEKADDDETPQPAPDGRPPRIGQSDDEPRGLGASFKKLRKLLGRAH